MSGHLDEIYNRPCKKKGLINLNIFHTQWLYQSFSQSWSCGILFISAFLIGFFHSLAPAHWLPVVLMAKLKKWSSLKVLLGSLMISGGHLFLSIGLALGTFWLGEQVIQKQKFKFYSSLFMIGFGLIYTLLSYRKHIHCQGHLHHGAVPQPGEKTPFLFLFFVGFSPCFAVVPLGAAALGQGMQVTFGTFLAYALGVLIAIIGACFLFLMGFKAIDHPWIEHHSDVLIGLSVSFLGIFLLIFSH